MRDLSFHQTLQQGDNAEYIFSGTFSASRIKGERALALTAAFGKTALFFCCLLGIGIALQHFWAGFQNGTAISFTERSPLNFIFWVTVLPGLYFWGWMHDEELQNKTMHTAKGKTIVDIFELFDYKAKRAWNNAFEISQQHKKPTVDSFDLLAALLEEKEIQLILYRFGRSPQELLQELSNEISQSGPSNLATPEVGSEDLLKLPQTALAEAMKLHDSAIDCWMLFCALIIFLPETHPIKKTFFKLDLTLQRIEIVCAWEFNLRKLSEDLSIFHRLAAFRPDNEINKGFTSLPTPALDSFSVDLTSAAKHSRLPIAIGREDDLANVFTMLSEGRSRIVIKAPEGTGRSTVINELAYKMVTEDVPQLLQDKRLVKVELSNLLGSHLPAEEVLVSALQEADYSGNIVLVLEDLHVLAKATSSKGLSLLEILVNYLEQSSLVCFATTTPYAYIDDLHHALNFDQLFASYELKELNAPAILLASCIQASLLEAEHKIFFTYPAIEKAMELTDQYVKDQGQPHKTIEVLTQAAVKQKSDAHDKRITPSIIEQIIAEKTHIPAETFSTSEADKLLNLETELAKYVIGQREAVSAVAEVLRRSRSGLAAANRPIASLLFVGPTGVGKTELAKTLARVYFGKEDFFLRLDMSEYQGNEGLQKLLGSDKNEADSIFVKHIKNYPFCLFLLDEFEKSSAEVRNLFLQILEDGRATTIKGETLDLTHTIIIATSNAGTQEIQNGLASGLSTEQIKTTLFENILLKHFSPELLNRFDSIILFTSLAPEEIQLITALNLQTLGAQIFAKKGITFVCTAAAINEISVKGFDSMLGARPIRRYIQDHVENLVARALLQNSYKKGGTITLDFKDGQLQLK